MHGGCRGLMGVSDLSKTECINQLATAGTGESAEIYPQQLSCLWEKGNQPSSLVDSGFVEFEILRNQEMLGSEVIFGTYIYYRNLFSNLEK